MGRAEGRRPSAGPRAYLLALIACGLAVGVSACGGTGAAKSPRSAEARMAMRLPAGSRLLRDVNEPLSSGYAADGSLYYAEPRPFGEHTGEIYDMRRVDPATGQVTAGRQFFSQLDHMLIAQGALWATSSSVSNQTWLWRLDPRTLRVRSHIELPHLRPTDQITGTLAVAGGQLWVGAGTLDRVSLRTGKVDRVLTPPHPGPVQVAAGDAGHVLLASFGYQNPTYLARLNPRTGQTLAQIKVGRSLGQPILAGIVRGGAWVENITTSTARAWRVDVATLQRSRTAAWAESSRRVGLQVDDGRLWITEPDGQANLNYCADPVTGRPEVRLPKLPGDSVFMTADAARFFYTDVPVNSHSVKLEAAPVSRACTT